MHPSMKRLLEVAGVEKKKADIANDLNVGASTVTNWTKRGVSKEGALAAAAKYNSNANYILDGLSDSQEKPSINELKRRMDLIQQGKRTSSDDMSSSEVRRVMLEEEVGDTIPVISWVAAGSWTEVMSVTLDDVITRIPRLPHLSPRAFGLIIQGRSMMPRFKPGDTIYVEPNITPWDLKDGDLIVVHCNDAKEATFKQLVIGETSDDMYLKPLNPDWHEQKMVPMGECTLVGIADTKIEALR